MNTIKTHKLTMGPKLQVGKLYKISPMYVTREDFLHCYTELFGKMVLLTKITSLCDVEVLFENRIEALSLYGRTYRNCEGQLLTWTEVK